MAALLTRGHWLEFGKRFLTRGARGFESSSESRAQNRGFGRKNDPDLFTATTLYQTLTADTALVLPWRFMLRKEEKWNNFTSALEGFQLHLF